MVIPPLNVGNPNKVLSHLEVALLKKSQSSLGIEGNEKLTESNRLTPQTETLEIQRFLSDLSNVLRLAGSDTSINSSQSKATPLPLCSVFWFSPEVQLDYRTFSASTLLYINITS